MTRILSLLSAAAVFVVVYVKGDPALDPSTDERVQVFHVCQGDSVYIPWPFDFMSGSHRGYPKVNLTFQGRRSPEKIVISFEGKRKSEIGSIFEGRVMHSHKYSGVFIQRLNLQFDGLYTARAQMKNGLVWTRKTEVVVHVRPTVSNNRLNVSIIKGDQSKERKDCITVECRGLESEGYPPVYYLWKHNKSNILMRELGSYFSKSTYQICPPFHGQLTCNLAGFSAMCTFDVSSSIDLHLPVSAVVAGSTSDTVLMIVIPVLAIGIPLLILGLWLCIHLLRAPRQRGQQKHHNSPRTNSTADHNHVGHPSNSIAMDHAMLPPSISFQSHHDLPPPILEDLNEERESIATIETSNRLIGLHSPPKQYRDPEETEKKDSLFKDDDDEEFEEKDDDDEEEEEDDEEDSDEDEDDEDEEEEEDEEDEGEEDDVDQQTKERRPLMEDSIHPIVT